MKRIITFFCIILMTAACSVTKPRPRQEFVSFLDFRPYTEAGFFISPDSYNGNFEAIGQLDIIVYPEIREVSNDYFYSSLTYENLSSENLLEIAVKNSIGKGANGLVNLRIEKIHNTISTKYSTTSVLSHYVITGFLIRITE